MRLTARETVVFAMLGAVMYASKVIMEFAPNIHLLGVFTVAYTVVYRKKALYPIYTYIILNGIFYGFATWWLPYLYIWAVLWGAVMLLPANMPKKAQPLVYMAVCAAHGFLFGTLYAPAQAVLYGLSFQGMIAWIVAGLYSWYQQFFLRDINYASDFDIEIGRKERDGHSLGNVEVRR